VQRNGDYYLNGLFQIQGGRIRLFSSVLGGKKMDWQHIYEYWLDSMHSLMGNGFGFDLRADDLAPFELVPIDHTPLDTLDWWPKFVSAGFVEDMKAGKAWGWGNKKGTLHTVELLFKNRENPERLAAVWIMAAIDAKMKDLPECWKGNNARLMRAMMLTVSRTFPDIEPWYHASREALPISITHYSPDDFINPKNEEGILYVFAVEASLCLANWQLIELVPEQYLGAAEK